MADAELTPAYFGSPEDPPPDWRREPDPGADDDEELAETPADVIALLGFDPLAETRSDASLLAPRLVDEGRAAGMYDPESKIISLADVILLGDGSRKIANPARVAAHEEGHAEDHALGWPSADPEFRALIEKAADELTDEEWVGAEYYLADPAEAFAEAWALLQGPEPGARYFGTMEPERAGSVLREVIEWTRKRASLD